MYPESTNTGSHSQTTQTDRQGNASVSRPPLTYCSVDSQTHEINLCPAVISGVTLTQQSVQGTFIMGIKTDSSGKRSTCEASD